MLSYFEIWDNVNDPVYLSGGLGHLSGDIETLRFISKDSERLSLKYRYLISTHNKKMTLSNINLDRKIIKACIKWRAYNTPDPSIKITPLHGTSFAGYNFYKEWKVTIFMLIIEYNFIKKALIYMIYKGSAPL
jgi:hypothetical protein